jgi:hypothetical protein
MNIIKTGWAKHEACMEGNRNACSILLGLYKIWRPLGTSSIDERIIKRIYNKLRGP